MQKQILYFPIDNEIGYLVNLKGQERTWIRCVVIQQTHVQHETNCPSLCRDYPYVNWKY